MTPEFIEKIYNKHQEVDCTPVSKDVIQFTYRLVHLLFHVLAEEKYISKNVLTEDVDKLKESLKSILSCIKKSYSVSWDVDEVADVIFEKIEFVYDTLLKDTEALYMGDPAAQDSEEVLKTYPGFIAIAFYRMAHEFYVLHVPLVPRIITEHAHSITGIDIHPGAEIGPYVCIDHGTGIVIGETTHIGEHVKLYQGVTLGALSVSKDMAETKRHPTIENGVVIYAGATILGGRTIIGANSVIGGNVWITKSIEPNSKVYHKAQNSYL